jgi:hypothetical protein
VFCRERSERIGILRGRCRELRWPVNFEVKLQASHVLHGNLISGGSDWKRGGLVFRGLAECPWGLLDGR